MLKYPSYVVLAKYIWVKPLTYVSGNVHMNVEKNTQLNNISPERCIGQMLEISMKTERETFGNARRGLENSDYTGRLK